MCPGYHGALESCRRRQKRERHGSVKRPGPVLAGRGGGRQAVSQNALEAGEGQKTGSVLDPPEGTSPGNTLLH